MARNPYEMDKFEGKGFDPNPPYPDLIKRLEEGGRTDEPVLRPENKPETTGPVMPVKKGMRRALFGSGGYAVDGE